MLNTIACLNYSKKIADADLSTMAQACALQVQRHLAPAWSLTPVAVALMARGVPLPAGTCVIGLYDAPDAPDALGYHTEAGDKIYGKVFVNPVLDNGGVPLFDPANPQNVSIASVLSHEVCELVCDPNVNRWVDGKRIAAGSEYAVEVCDPVESDSYAVAVATAKGDVQVSVSNFVFPEWFDPQTPASARVDYMKTAHGPFHMTKGGYMVVRTGPGHEKQVFGDQRPAWRATSKSHDLSRWTKRHHAI